MNNSPHMSFFRRMTQRSLLIKAYKHVMLIKTQVPWQNLTNMYNMGTFALLGRSPKEVPLLIDKIIQGICLFFVLAKYYSSAITEIGLALFSTCVILNFYYKQDRMPNWLKPFMFSILGRLVLIKYDYKQTKDTKGKSRKQFLIEENFELSEFSGNTYSAPCDIMKMNTINESNCEENGSCSEVEQRLPIQHKRSRTRSSNREIPSLNEHVVNNHHQGQCICQPDGESRDDELINNRMDWQTAAKILDRVVLVLGILISFATFLTIFLQAPRVREMFS